MKQTEIFSTTLKKIKVVNESNKEEDENIFSEKFFSTKIKEYFIYIKNFLISFYRETVVFYRNTSFFHFFIIFLFFIVSIFSYFEHKEFKTNNSSGYILPFVFVECNYKGEYEILYKNVKSVFLIAFFNSITKGIVVVFVTFILLLIIGYCDFFIKNNFVKKKIIQLSTLGKRYSFFLNILMFRYFYTDDVNILIILFIVTQLFFNYCVINQLLEKKKKIPFIDFNLTRGVKKKYILINSIVPHCKLELVNIYISFIKDFFLYCDTFPSIKYELLETRTRSMYTFVFLLTSSFKSLLNNEPNQYNRIPYLFAWGFLFFIFITYLFLMILISHIRIYFIRKGIYEHK